MTRVLVGLAALAVCHAAAAAELKSPSVFADIADPAARSAAMFTEAARVILNPRCANCHPAGSRPFQGDEERPHIPAVQRGAGGLGVPGLYCGACHHDGNFDAGHVPGNPEWALAPAEMAWHGKSVPEVCQQIKDPGRNGGRSLSDIVDHMAHDELVGWGWHPDAGRMPAPGTQKGFGELIAAWVQTGAVCPATE